MNLQNKKVRVVYLVTYSQTDMSIIHNRRKFSDIVVRKFSRCSQENRKNNKKRFPFSLSLKIRQGFEVGWIHLKFRDFRGYYPTYMYVTKKDLLYLLSYSHPTEIESPQIAQPTEKRSELAEKQESCDTPSAINKRKENFSPQIYTTL